MQAGEQSGKKGLVVCKNNVKVYTLSLTFPLKYLSFVTNVLPLLLSCS